MNTELRSVVKTLFDQGRVKTVVGYREHPLTRAVVPAVIDKPEDACQLIYDKRCVFNLARSVHADLAAPIGVVLKGCDGRALNMRITEGDFTREQIVAIAVACPGVQNGDNEDDGAGIKLADSCMRCSIRVSPLADLVVGDPATLPAPSTSREAAVAEIRRKSPQERFEFWRQAFDPCIRCYACRQVCPLCSCAICITEHNTPQWIEHTPKPSSNMAWHFIRALHHAGRCVDCGECQRVCPENIPMHLLDLCLMEDVEEMFGFVTGAKDCEKWPFLLYDPGDPDTWLKPDPSQKGSSQKGSSHG